MVTTMRNSLLAALLLAAILGAAQAQQPGPGAPPAVGVATVKREPITEMSEFIGRIQAVNRVDVVARVTAYLEKRLFTEGAEVKAGDVLYRLERAPFEAQVAAQAAAVAQADAQVQINTIHLNRFQALLTTPAGQRSTVEDASSALRTSQAQLAAA